MELLRPRSKLLLSIADLSPLLAAMEMVKDISKGTPKEQTGLY
jgi:hypothetical protein